MRLRISYWSRPCEEFCSFERREDVDENPTEEEESRGILFELVGAAVGIFLFGSLVLGAMMIFEWLGMTMLEWLDRRLF